MIQRHVALRPVVAACCALLLGSWTTAAGAREPDVDEWVERTLSRYVADTLSAHPRFKDASVRFVVMRNGTPQSDVDALSLRLRDRLQRRVVDARGVTVAWRPDRPGTRMPSSGAECSADAVQYLVGLELSAPDPDAARVSVRAMDVVERTWVAGFGLEWRGRLSGEQYRASRRSAQDRGFLGERGVPYASTETDLVAAHLAHDLRCKLMREVAGDYVIGAPPRDHDGTPLPGVLSLVSQHIADLPSLRLVENRAAANATLGVRAHPVDGELHQYWVTLMPRDAASGLAPVTSNVYVRLPPAFATHAGDADDRGVASVAAATTDGAAIAELPHADTTAIGGAGNPGPSGRGAGSVGRVPAGAGGVLGSLRLVQRLSGRACRSGHASHTSRPPDCAGLEVRTRQAAVVFVLNHRRGHGLVRVDSGECSHRAATRIARGDEPVMIPLPSGVAGDAWLPQPAWHLEPDGDTYYAIAVDDSRVARSIASHLERLPRHCPGTAHDGYAGGELAHWLTGFAEAVERWRPHVDWNAVSVSHAF